MSRRPDEGTVEFDRVTKLYALGKRRAYFAAAWPFGPGVSTKRSIAALRDVSFKVLPGESFALIGANGAGKSTALKCLAGITHQTDGHIRFGGRIVPLVELGVGFHPDLSGFDNVRFAAALAGIRGSAVDTLVDKAVEFSELSRFMTTPVKHYSSGMFARLSFAIAASLPAEILIVDEILAVGDVAFQRKCYQRLQQLRHDEGTTLIFVSHNEWALKETCQRGVLLSKGEVVKEGDVGQLLRAYHALRSEERPQDKERPGQLLRIGHVDTVPSGNRRFRLHDAIVLDIEVMVTPEAHKGAVAVVLSDQNRQIIWACYSDEQGIQLAPGSTYRLRARIDDLNMLPGPGSVEVSVLDRSTPVVEANRVLEIQVESDDDMATGWGQGLVHAPSSWEILSREPG